MLHKHTLRASVILLVLPVVALPILILGLFGAAVTAHAASEDKASRLIATVEVGMNVDCSRVPNTVQAHQVLAQHGLCGYGINSQQAAKTVTSGAITPDSVRRIVCGNCGCLILDLFNSGGGYLHWKGQITSNLGAMVNAFYSGYWLNTSRGNSGGVNRNSGPIFTTDWVDNVPYYTRSGGVYGEIDSATSILFYGLVCQNADAVWNVTTVT